MDEPIKLNPEVIMEYNKLVFDYLDMALTRGHIPQSTKAELNSARLISGMIDDYLSQCGIEPKKTKPGQSELEGSDG